MVEKRAKINLWKTKEGGVTLVELMIVIAVVGILSTTGLFYGRKYSEKGKIAAAKNQMRLLGLAIQQYHNRHKFDANLAKRWPSDAVSSPAKSEALCGAGSGKIQVPPDLITENLWSSSKEARCLDIDYENWPEPCGFSSLGCGPASSYDSDHVVALTWSGLDGDRLQNEDNLILMILGDKKNLDNLKTRFPLEIPWQFRDDQILNLE